MRGALPWAAAACIAAVLTACNASKRESERDPSGGASAPAPAIASAPPVLGPKVAASPEERERVVLSLLSGREQAESLPEASADPDRVLDKYLRLALTKAPSKVDVAVIEVRGIPEATLRRMVAADMPRWRACYVRSWLSNPNLQGKVVIRATLGANGGVDGVETEGTDLPRPWVVGCVVRRFKELVFPRPETSEAMVNLSLSFAPPDG